MARKKAKRHSAKASSSTQEGARAAPTPAPAAAVSVRRSDVLALALAIGMALLCALTLAPAARSKTPPVEVELHPLVRAVAEGRADAVKSLLAAGTDPDALDAQSGEELWNISLGRRVHAAPMTFAVDGHQYVTIASGNVVYTFGLRN